MLVCLSAVCGQVTAGVGITALSLLAHLPLKRAAHRSSSSLHSHLAAQLPRVGTRRDGRKHHRILVRNATESAAT